MKEHTAEIVVKAGAEGGSLTLFREPSSIGAFEYFTDLNAMGVEDIPGLYETSRRVKTLEQAFKLLDKAPGCEWHQLRALEVHPAHRADVLAAVESRLHAIARAPRTDAFSISGATCASPFKARSYA